MFRRSRLSIRPNVGTAGRTAGSAQETSSNKDQEDDANTGVETPVSVSDNKPADPPTEQTPSIDQNGEAPSSSAIQRRKRFSVRPKVVPGRPSVLPRTAKPPIKPVLPTVKSPVIDKAETLIELNSPASHQELQTPKEGQPSNESRSSKIDTASPPEISSKCINQHGKIQSSLCSQVKESSSKAPVPHSLPDREAIAISEKAKTLVSRTELKAASQNFSLTQLLNDKSDLLRLEKARKLRQLLKQEMLKEKSKKCVARVKECTLDPSKMTMRDLIHYLPTSNPMSSTEDSVQENENAIPQSPDRETSPERAQEQEVHPKTLSPGHGEATATTSVEEHQEHEEEAEEAAEEAEEAEEADVAAEDDDALMVPQVKVAEDGSLIIDEESLTVEVQRMKGPNPIQDRDPIFERGSTTTYSSFRKGTHTKPWSTEETDMFFLAISMVGTDFAMISQLFPHRARSEIKNKFKKEERCNTWRIDKAFRERRKLDLEYFKKLLEKIIEFQQNKKKLKSMSDKPKTSKRKAKGKKALAVLSDVEEVNEDGVSIEQQEGEKENLCNEKTSSSKTKRKKTCKDFLSQESPVGKKRNKRPKKLSDDAGNHADLEEATIPEEHPSLALSNKTETQAVKTAEAKSGKPRPLGRKGLKATKVKAVVSDAEGDTTSDETERQIKRDSFSSQQSAKRLSDNDSSDHETTLPSARPSRYGRISKPVQPLNYPAKEDTNSSDTLASPAHQTAAAKAKNKTHGKRKSAKQRMSKESKKPKLITLRASQSEGSDDDDEEETNAQHYDDENSTNAFVPASLCSPKPVVPEVQETMEELDMLAHMPDVLGMSENALCPDASCEQVQNGRGDIEPCEHQLDLLVDVIGFLSEHAEEDDEAAQTLLEIGNPANLVQPTEGQPSLSDHISKFESHHCSEVDDFSKSSFDQEECTELVSATSNTENIPTNSQMEQPPTAFTSETPSGELSDFGSSTHISTPSAENSVLARKGRLSKIKPKPNVGSSTRTTKLPTQTIGAVMKSQQDAANNQHQSLGQPEESTLAVSEPSKTDAGSADDMILVMPTSHVSNVQVSSGPCCKPDTVDSPQLQTTPEPKMNLSAPMRQILPKIKPNIGPLRTTKPTVEAVDEEVPQVEREMTSTTKLGSLEHQEESTLVVSEQDEPCSTQRTATSQLEPLCAENSSAPRRGRLSKIKPKPNVKCASRTSKLSSQTVHDNAEKLEDKSEMASTSQLESSEHCSDAAWVDSTQSICQIEITDRATEDMPASQTSDPKVIKHRDEPSTTEQTAATSELETACSKNSSVQRKGRFSKIKPKPNIESASRITKQPLQSVDTERTVSETATASQQQSVAPPLSTSFVGSRPDFHQESLTHSEISGPQEQGEELSTLEEHVGQFTEMSCTPAVQCTVEPPEKVEDITSLEREMEPSAQRVPASAQEKTENLAQLSDPSSESLKHSTPQRRRWVPKFKPKPNLLSSPRTAKSRLESEEMTQAPHTLVKSSLLNAKSEQPMLQDCSSAKPHDHLQSVNLEPNSSSSVPSMLGISLGEEMTNVSKTDIIYETCAPNWTNMDHCNPMECTPSDSSKNSTTLPQLEDLKKTEICLVSNFNVVTSGISTDDVRPAEGAVVPSTEAAPLLSQDQVKESSLQNSFESPLFPNIPPDQVPSDPDEPFFILSLTEIPVCPSGEEVNPRPESYHAVPDTEAQQSNPVEFVVPLTHGMDDSLSNIHIPTPEKATFNSRVICVEEYLPSAPSVDISILEEPQENPSIQRLNSPEAESNFELSAYKQPSIRSDVKCSRRPNLMRKTPANKTNELENMTLDPPESFTQMESSEAVCSQTQKGSGVTSGKIKKTYEASKNKSQTKNAKVSLWGGTETQSSEAATANVWTSSFSSELISPKQRDSTNTLDEEPTNMSDYSFGDVFHEVEGDSSVTGPITGDTACHDNKPRQPAETKTQSSHRDSSCGQQSPITAAPQTPEATADRATPSNLSGSSATETTVHSRQHDNKTSRGRRKGNARGKMKTSGDTKAENSRPQRKSTIYFPEALSLDTLKKSPSSSSTIPPQTHETNHLSSLQNTSEVLNSHQSDSIGSSFLEEEPTNVSQYFFSDVFTEVESEDFPFTAKSDSISSCSGTAPSRAETEVDERLKRKDSSDPNGQHSSLTEGQPPDATSSILQNTPSSTDVTMTDSSQRNTKKTRGKGSSKKKSNTICQSLRKSADTSKTPEAVLQDSLKETQSTSSAAQPQNQRGSLLASNKVPVDKDGSIVEVDCGTGSVTKTINSDNACGDKAQTQRLETSGNTRKKRKEKASSLALIQESAHEASVTHEAQKNTFDSSQMDIGKTRGSIKGRNKVSDEETTKRSRPQRQDTAASKSQRIKENLSAMLQATNQSDSKESCPFDEEPTNVSQYFLSDIFTDVEEEFKS